MKDFIFKSIIIVFLFLIISVFFFKVLGDYEIILDESNTDYRKMTKIYLHKKFTSF